MRPHLSIRPLLGPPTSVLHVCAPRKLPVPSTPDTGSLLQLTPLPSPRLQEILGLERRDRNHIDVTIKSRFLIMLTVLLVSTLWVHALTAKA